MEMLCHTHTLKEMVYMYSFCVYVYIYRERGGRGIVYM